MSDRKIDISLVFDADTSKAKRQLADLYKQLDNLSKSNNSSKILTQKDIEQLRKASDLAGELKTHLVNAANSNTGKLDLGLLNESLKQSGKSLSYYANELKALGPAGQRAFSTLTSSILQAEVPLKRTHETLLKFKQTLANTLRWQVSSKMLMGFTGAIQTAYYYAKDLDKSLNNIRIVTKQSTEQMTQFAKEANKAAQSLSTTTLDYTNASLIYYQQGLSDEEVKARTDVTVKMSNVTRQAAEDVSNQMTAVWNNFAKGSESLEYYADVMTGLGAATASSSAEIAEGLSKFASVADTVGLSFEYATAALATVTATTRQSADIVGNAFKTLFGRLESLKLGDTLEDGTDFGKYSEALLKVGINIKDNIGNLKSMNDILDEMGAKWNTLSKDQQMALAQSVGGVRQYTQLVALMENYDKFQKNVGIAKSSEGELQKQNEIYAEGWEAAAKRVRTAAEQIYDNLINEEFFVKLNDFIAGFLKGIDKTIKGLGGLKGVLTLIGSVGLKVFSKDLASGIDKFIYNLQDKKKIAEKMREEAIQSAYQMNDINPDSKYTGYMDVAFESQVRAQEAYIQNAENMNEIEKSISKTLLEQLDARVQNHIEAVKQFEILEETLKEEQKEEQIKLKFYNDSTIAPINRINTQKYEIKKESLTNLKTVLNIPLKISNIQEIKKQFENTINSIDLTGMTEKFREKFANLQEIFSAEGSTDEERYVALDKMQQLIKQMQAIKGGSLASLVFDKASLERIKEAGIDIEALTTNAANLAIEENHLSQENKELGNSSDQVGRKIEGFSSKALSTGSAISLTAQSLTSFVGLINQISGAWDILNNEDMSWAEKALSIFTSFISVLPMVIMSYQQLAGAKITVNKISLAELKTHILETPAKLKTAIANKFLAKTEYEVAAGAGAINVALGPIVAVLTVLVGVISFAVNKYKSYKKVQEEELKQLEEENKKIRQRIENSSDLISSLKEELELYVSLGDNKEKLDKVTQQLCDTYDLEGAAIARLTGRYADYLNILNQAEQKREDEIRIEAAGLEKEITDSEGETYKVSWGNLSENYRGRLETFGEIKGSGKLSFEDDIQGEIAFYDEVKKIYAEILALGDKANKDTKNAIEELYRSFDTDRIEENRKKINQLFVDKAVTQKFGGIELDNIEYKNQFEQWYEAIKEAIPFKSLQDEIFGAIFSNSTNSKVKQFYDKSKAVEEYQKLVEEVEELSDDQKVKIKEKISEILDEENGELVLSFINWNDLSNTGFEELIEKARQYALALAGVKEAEEELENAKTIYEIAQKSSFDETDIKKLYDAGMSDDEILEFFGMSQEDRIKKYGEKYTNTRQASIDRISPEDAQEKINSTNAQIEILEAEIAELEEQAAAWVDKKNNQVGLPQAQKDLGAIISEFKNGDQNQEAQEKFAQAIDEALFGDTNPILADYIRSVLKYNSGQSFVTDYISGKFDDVNFGNVNYDVTDWKNYDNLEKKRGQLQKAYADRDSQQQAYDTTSQEKKVKLELELANASSMKDLKILQQLFGFDSNGKEAKAGITSVFSKAVKDLGIDMKTLVSRAEALKKEYKLSEMEAAEMALQIERTNKGLNILNKNSEDWIATLKEGYTETNDQYFETISNIKDALADVFNVDSSQISDEFIVDAENIKLIEEAANGSKEALDKLIETYTREKIIIGLGLNEEDINKYKETLDVLTDFDLLLTPDMDNSKLLEKLNEMVRAVGWSTDKVSEFFGNLGYSIEVTSVKYPLGAINGKDALNMKKQGISLADEFGSTEIEIPVIKFISRKNEFGGGINDKTKNSGGGSKRKPKDPEKLDRYWNINNAIKKVSNALEKYNAQLQQLQTMQSHLFGQELIDNLKKQNALIGWRNKLLEQQKGNYQKLYAEQSRELDELKKKLTSAGGSFTGDILTNYASLWNTEYAKYKKAEAAYIAGGSEEAWESAQKHWEQIKELIDRYQELFYTDMAETQQNLEDIAQQELENKLQILANNLQMWEITVKAKLDLTEAKRNLDKFLKEVEQDFRKVYQDLTIDSKFNAEAFATYKDDIQTTLDAIKDVEAEIDKINAGGESDKFASVSEAQEKLKELQQQLLDQAELLNQMYQEVWNNYIDGLNQVKDKFNDIIKQYERISDELNYERELVELLYGDKAYDLMNKFYDAQQKNILGQIDSMKQQMSFWESEFQKAYEMNRAKHNVDMNDMSTWTEDMQIAYENMQEAQSSLNSLILEGVKNLQEDYMNAINKVLSTMDSNVWRMSFDDMKDDWDHIQNLAGEYLDDIEGAYRIQTLANKIDQSIASSLNTKAQQKLQDLREKEIKMLREKENLTQDDIDLAEQRYQIALKEIALEEAQNSKTSMKLTRDTSGNWTYQYVADETDVLKKQQDLLDAYNSLYETADKAYNHAMELAMNTYQEMQEKIREIAEDMTLSEEEKEQKIQAIYDKYLSEIEAAVGNSELYRQEAMMASAAVFSEICEQDEDTYENLTENQKRLVDELKEHNLNNYEEIRSAIVDDLYPSMSEAAEASFGEMNLNSQTAAASVISDWAKDNGTSVRGMLKAALYDLTNQIRNYESELDKLQRIAEVDFDKIGQAIDKTSQKTENMRDQTQDMCETAEDYLEQLRTAVNDVTDAWEEMIGKIQDAIRELEEYIRTKQEADNQDDNGGDSNDDNPTPSPTPPEPGPTPGPTPSKEPKPGDVATLTTGYAHDSDGGYPWGTLYKDKPKGVKVDFTTDKKHSHWVHIKSADGKYPDLGWVYPGALTGYDTGGYTGSWDSSGKLAMLHQKELVLNASDTINMLKTVEAVRDLGHLSSSIDAAIAGSLSNLVASMIAGRGYSMNTNTNSNSENVFNITAEFPNANDVDSIREAILSLPNLASQYLNEK